MANYAVVTNVIIHNKEVDGEDTVAGSYAKKVSDFIESVDSGKVIRSIHSFDMDGTVITVIVHDSVAS